MVLIVIISYDVLHVASLCEGFFSISALWVYSACLDVWIFFELFCEHSYLWTQPVCLFSVRFASNSRSAAACCAVNPGGAALKRLTNWHAAAHAFFFTHHVFSNEPSSDSFTELVKAWLTSIYTHHKMVSLRETHGSFCTSNREISY